MVVIGRCVCVCVFLFSSNFAADGCNVRRTICSVFFLDECFGVVELLIHVFRSHLIMAFNSHFTCILNVRFHRSPLVESPDFSEEDEDKPL